VKTKFKKNDSSNHLKQYSKYSGIAIQMLVIILLGVFGGVKIDYWIGWELPIFTVLLSISAVFLAIYIVTKDLIKKK
jgi:hypothetical protein